MRKTDKKFDAVEMMRSARDRISAEIEGMTLEEELQWLASQSFDDPPAVGNRVDGVAPRLDDASRRTDHQGFALLAGRRCHGQ